LLEGERIAFLTVDFEPDYSGSGIRKTEEARSRQRRRSGIESVGRGKQYFPALPIDPLESGHRGSNKGEEGHPSASSQMV
jgi:hypothetical protein